MTESIYTAPDECRITSVETKEGEVYAISNCYVEMLQIGADYRLYAPLYSCGEKFIVFPLMSVSKLPDGAELVSEWRTVGAWKKAEKVSA